MARKEPHALIGGLVVAVMLTFATAAEAEAKSCGGYRSAPNGLGVDITAAKGVRCNVAWNVAFGFDNVGWEQVSPDSDDAAIVHDRQGRKWTCRVTAWATGSDTGYQPFTKVRCKRRSKVVRFRFSS
jgi:hypothetical protein